MDALESTEILLVEDSDADAELMIRALGKGNVINKLVRVHEGKPDEQDAALKQQHVWRSH